MNNSDKISVNVDLSGMTKIINQLNDTISDLDNRIKNMKKNPISYRTVSLLECFSIDTNIHTIQKHAIVFKINRNMLENKNKVVIAVPKNVILVKCDDELSIKHHVEHHHNIYPNKTTTIVKHLVKINQFSFSYISRNRYLIPKTKFGNKEITPRPEIGNLGIPNKAEFGIILSDSEIDFEFMAVLIQKDRNNEILDYKFTTLTKIGTLE